MPGSAAQSIPTAEDALTVFNHVLATLSRWEAYVLFGMIVGVILALGYAKRRRPS